MEKTQHIVYVEGGVDVHAHQLEDKLILYCFPEKGTRLDWPADSPVAFPPKKVKVTIEVIE